MLYQQSQEPVLKWQAYEMWEVSVRFFSLPRTTIRFRTEHESERALCSSPQLQHFFTSDLHCFHVWFRKAQREYGLRDYGSGHWAVV